MCGVYRIINLKSDMAYVDGTDDAEGICASQRFRLDLGMHPMHSLQEDYSRTGLELFTIEVVETCDADELASKVEDWKRRSKEEGLSLYQRIGKRTPSSTGWR